MQRANQSVSAQSVVLRGDRQFVLDTWAAGLRPDQRGFLQLRMMSIEFPFDQRNLCVVKVGNTTVSSAVTCDLVEPSPFQPKHGFLEISVAVQSSDGGSGAAGPSLRPQQLTRTPQAVAIAALLESLLKTGKAVDTESLCALPGRKVWSIRLDVVVLNDDGNATDAAVLAGLAVLQHYRRPELTIRGDTVTVHPPHERDPIPLSIHHVPLSLTFAVGPGLLLVADPSLAEAGAASSTVTVALNAELQVCHLSKTDGGECVPLDVLQRAVQIGKQLQPKLQALIKSAMEEHDTRRKEMQRAQFSWAQQRVGVGKGAPPAPAPTHNGTEGEPASKKPRLE